MQLFHASLQVYARGQVIGDFAASSFHALMTSTGNGWIETALAGGRPPTAPSRSVAQYAFDNAAACWNFLSGQQGNGIGGTGVVAGIHLYEIEMAGPWPAPMAIVGRLEKLGAAHSHIPAAVAEYWQPKAAWSNLEYLDVAFTVISEVAKPGLKELGGAVMDSENDWRLARTLFP